MTQIIIRDLNLGGIADSKYAGLPNSAFKIVGFNLHEEPGILKVQQNTIDDRVSGAVLNQKCRAIVPSSDGNTYLFGKSGRIWKRSTAANYTEEVSDVNPASGDSTLLDAQEFDGAIYYSMPQRLGKWTIGTSWGTRNDNFKTLDFDDEFHPIFILENKMFVGNGNKIDSLDSVGTYTAAALTLDNRFVIQSLSKIVDHLIIGTITEGTAAKSFAGFSHILNWDTRSLDLTSDITLPEFGINAFIDFYGSLIIQAGKKGNFYSYSGQAAARFRRLPGDWSGTKEGVTEANAVSSYLGFPVFGFSNESGDPTEQGVYSLGSFDAKYPTVFTYEFETDLTPAGGFEYGQTEIGAIEQVRTDIGGTISQDLIFSYEQTFAPNGKRISRVDNSNKYDRAFIETQIINTGRDKLKNFRVTVCYRSLPADTAINVLEKTNDASFYSTITMVNWANKKCLISDVNIINAANIQFKIATDVSANDAPEIEQIIIDFNVETPTVQ